MRKEKELLEENVLSDEAIIALYWSRNEQAITETDRKYKRYLYTIAYNILHDHSDCEECLNDTYLGTWNKIPPTKPSIFQVFLSKIMRNIAVVRYKHNKADKRIPSELTTSLEELEPFIPTAHPQQEYLISELGRLISIYLRTLSERSAFIFICRYYCSDRIADIAAMLHISERTVFRELTDIRQGLKEFLKKEGYLYA